MEGVDTCEQGVQNLIALYSIEQTDRVARRTDNSHLPGKETTITAEPADGISPRSAAGVSARRALLAPVPGRPGHGADAAAALAPPAPAAQRAVL